jgi:hypothetical protein
MARRMRRSRRLATATLHLLLLSAMSCGSPGGGSEPPGGTDATTDLIDVDASLAPNAETLDSSPNPDDGANAPEDGADADADTGEVQDTAVGDSEDSDASSDVSDTPDVPVSDVADGDVPSTDAQSWEQKWQAQVGPAPASCDALPPLCSNPGGSSGVWFGKPKPPDFSGSNAPASYKNFLNGKALAWDEWRRVAVLDALGYLYGKYEFGGLGRWMPVAFEENTPGVIDVYGTWINQVWVVRLNEAKSIKNLPPYCNSGLESVLPTGCLRFRIDLQSNKVIETTLVATKPDAFLTTADEFDGVVGCAATLGKAPPKSGGPLQFTASTGVVVVAHPGRPRPERQLLDPLADLSQLVRAMPENPGLPGQATQAAIEIIAQNGDKTPIATDVSFCHATEKNVSDSGCGCNLPPTPAQPPTTAESSLEIVAPPLAVTITESWLASAFGPTWNGADVDIGNKTSESGWGSMFLCCLYDQCPVTAPKYICAGSAGTQWDYGLYAAFSGMPRLRSFEMRFFCKQKTGSKKPDAAEIAKQLPLVGAPWLDGHGSFVWYLQTPTKLPHTQRDARWISFQVWGSGSVSLLAFGPQSADVTYEGEGALVRRTTFLWDQYTNKTLVPFKARMKIFAPAMP